LSDTIIKTERITKKYGKFCAVDSLDLEVRRGEIYGLVGRNGAGKTTLLKMICGLSVPDAGSVALFGETGGSALNTARIRTGCIVETPGFLPYLSAEDNLEYYRLQRGLKDKKRIAGALEFVGLSDAGRKKYKNFSLGMKQRLGLALAVMNEPELLILDEPINGLDPMGIAEFRELLLKLNSEKKTTILISSHILGELSQIATTFGFMNGGRMVEHLSARELTEKCRASLKLKVNDTGLAGDVLRNKLSCTAFRSENGNELLLDDYLDAPELVVQSLVLNNVMVSGVEQTGMNLEEYFIRLVGGLQHA
jgi:ABC-2 type transport system ATP-binding protein